MSDGSATRLLRWYRAAGRDLPWRGPFPRDPYRTLVAEVMAQQTQIDRVIPVYLGFVRDFPTLQDAASAGVDAVLRAFTGLGYYRRARLLHAALVAVDAAGGWPQYAKPLAALPGLGPYTSAAVAAFCFGAAEPPVDGNIARIAARVRSLEHPTGSRELLRAAAAFARGLHAAAPTPEVWEALMDLGATVCTPVAPACGGCPLAADCRARAQGRSAALPAKRPRRPAERHVWAAIWARRSDGRVLLRQVSMGPLLEGLWLPPLAEVPPHEAPLAVGERLARSLGFSGVLQALPPVRHAITHRRLTVHGFALHLDELSVGEAVDRGRWALPSDPSLATSTLLHKMARAAAQA